MIKASIKQLSFGLKHLVYWFMIFTISFFLFNVNLEAAPAYGISDIDMGKIPVGAISKNYLDVIPADHKPLPNKQNHGEFIIQCNYSHMLKDDPILKPNEPGSSYLHTFIGNSQADSTSTNDTLKSRGSSSCDGGIMNRSAYYVPSMIDTRSGTPLAPNAINVLYKTSNSRNVKELPEGIRLVAAEHSYFWCASPENKNISSKLSYIPYCPAGSRVIEAIDFPNWWNGKDLDSEDHKSHMSYVKTSTHNVELAKVTYNIIYNVYSGSDTNHWRLSSDTYDADKKGGYSSYGNLINGWTDDPETGINFQKIIIKGCLKAAVNCGNALLGDGRQYYY